MQPLLTLLLSGTLILCALFSLCFLLIQIQQQKQRRRQMQIDGLMKLNVIRRLLTWVQQHRGLSNGILHGDITLKVRMQAVTEKVNQLSHDIISVYPDLLENERWQAMGDHWQRLSSDYLNLNIRNNLEQHNKLVLNLLYLINDIAYDNKLHQVTNSNSESVQFLWQELLFTAESIAQIRALGTGIAAAQICTSAEHIRLRYLCQSLQQSINIQTNPDYLLKISHLLKVINEQIMINRPTIKANQFFNIATESIDMILAHFDQQLEGIKININT